MLAVLGKGAAFRFKGQGFSMYPFIQDGDVITLSPWGKFRLHSGDVVAFRHPNTGKLAVHRVLDKEAQGFLLRGDNCLAPDGLIPITEILGRVIRVERNGRLLRLGWGPERRLLALLSRHHFLRPLVHRTGGWLRALLRRKPR